MKEFNLKELETLYHQDRVSYHKIRNSLTLESNYKNDDTKLFLFDSITKAFFRSELKKIVLMLTEYRFLGFKLHYGNDYDDEPELVVMKQVNEDWIIDKSKDTQDNFSFLRAINRIIDTRQVIDKLNYDPDDIENLGVGIFKILNNEFFKEQVNSTLLFNKLDEKLEEKSFVKKLLKI